MTSERLISFVIPAYNEVESIPILLERISTVAEQENLNYEVVFVDDGSTDGTLDVLIKAANERDDIRTLEFRRNFGKSAGLAAGFAEAKGDVIITMDADLQDDPDEIPNMLAKLDEGYDLVTGWKADRKDPITKTVPSFIANTTTRIFSGVSVKDMNSGFKCYRAELAKSINLYGDLHRYVPILAHAQGFTYTEIPVKHHARQYGQSKYGFSRFLRGLMDLFTVLFISEYRYRPLHLFGGVGLAMGMIGFLIEAYLTVLWFMGNRPIGDRPLLLLGILLIVVGVQFLSIGLVAELSVSINRQKEDPLAGVRKLHG